jgi:hypothetical protein
VWYVFEECRVSIPRAKDCYATNMVIVHPPPPPNSHILKDRNLHSRRRFSEKKRQNSGTTRSHTRRKPRSCLGVFRVLTNYKPHSMNTTTLRYSATLSPHSTLDGEECDVMSDMPNGEHCSVALPQKCSISFPSIFFSHYSPTNVIRPPHTVY